MDNKLLSLAITKGIAHQENGGKWPTDPVKGKTGEMRSIFQYTPDTWKNYAGQVTGDPNTPMNPDTETFVTNAKVGKWLDDLTKQGKSPQEATRMIASMWNAGQGEPNAYTGKFSNGSPSVGVNKKYGVPFNVPKYAEGVSRYADEFYGKLASQGGQQQQAPEDAQQGGRNGLLGQLAQNVPQRGF